MESEVGIRLHRVMDIKYRSRFGFHSVSNGNTQQTLDVGKRMGGNL